jgi:hypothetical protein
MSVAWVATNGRAGECGGVIEHRGMAVIALPPNKALQLTSRFVTPFACAKVAPNRLAAEL